MYVLQLKTFYGILRTRLQMVYKYTSDNSSVISALVFDDRSSARDVFDFYILFKRISIVYTHTGATPPSVGFMLIRSCFTNNNNTTVSRICLTRVVRKKSIEHKNNIIAAVDYGGPIMRVPHLFCDACHSDHDILYVHYGGVKIIKKKYIFKKKPTTILNTQMYTYARANSLYANTNVELSFSRTPLLPTGYPNGLFRLHV
jgi:hypothetical protein